MIPLELIVETTVTVAFAVGAWYLMGRLAQKLQVIAGVKRFLMRLRTALLALVAGNLVALAFAELVQVFPPDLSPYLDPNNPRFVAGIVALALAVRALISQVSDLTVGRVAERGIGRVLNAGVLLLSVIAATQIVLRSHVAPQVSEFWWRVLNLFTGLLVAYIAAAVLDLLLTHALYERVATDQSSMTAFTFIRRVLVISVGLLGALAALLVTFPELLGIATSSLIAAGFLSIVIGLAAQSTLSNLISGLMISLSHPFRIGEALMFRNDFCFVEDIKLFHTVLRTWDNRRLVVPNSVFQSEVIVNYSAIDPTMLVPVFVDVSYESDLDKAMSIMRELAERHPLFLPAQGLPQVQVMELGESGIRLRLLVRAKDQTTGVQLARELLYQIHKEFRANGIEIPYPRRYVIVADSQGSPSKRAGSGGTSGRRRRGQDRRGRGTVQGDGAQVER
ncbi:MAG: mechanosensitive ion channel family protein [Thaumarchaeota archaeon]|nr:mechanosensitive ion channel family protein [Candidatus Calditenuaceae archaeon]MDW8186549.1 mechanosensitive ion channel family protein [Nitrososphaerota archaeon]